MMQSGVACVRWQQQQQQHSQSVTSQSVTFALSRVSVIVAASWLKKEQHSKIRQICARLCLCARVRPTGADCFDAISRALMNPLVCLTTCLSWRAEGGKHHGGRGGSSLRCATWPLHGHIYTPVYADNMLGSGLECVYTSCLFRNMYIWSVSPRVK